MLWQLPSRLRSEDWGRADTLYPVIDIFNAPISGLARSPHARADLSWRRALASGSRQGFDYRLKRLEHCDECFSGATIAVGHEHPDGTRAWIILHVGRITRFRARVPERNHSTTGPVTLNPHAEFIVNARLAKGRREAEPFPKRHAPRTQVG
jgi:hypothetical protein